MPAITPDIKRKFRHLGVVRNPPRPEDIVCYGPRRILCNMIEPRHIIIRYGGPHNLPIVVYIDNLKLTSCINCPSIRKKQ